MLKNILRITLYKYIAIFFLFILVIGAVSTYIHFINNTIDYHSLFKININIISMNILIIIGLLVRFFKWHLFLRAYQYRIKIRKSFGIFFSSLFINLFFPFLIGEVLAKCYFLKKENCVNTRKNLTLVILERLLDLIPVVILRINFASFISNNFTTPNHVSSIVLLLKVGLGTLLLLLLFVSFTVNMRLLLKLIVCFLIGFLGWLFPYLIYFTFPGDVLGSLSFNHFGYIFSNYLMFFSSTPMGIFLSANYLYLSLEKIIQDPILLFQTAINIRIASIAPRFVLGLTALYYLIKRMKNEQLYHFDEISNEYADIIPQHIQERLIERKCKLILDNLNIKFQNGGSNLRGLDLGGGKGWYTSRIIDSISADVILVERSFNQAKDAVKRDKRIKAVIADIQYLPFKDSSFDFGFSINVFHHLDDQASQLRAFESLSHVLRNNHFFYLHEINVHNVFSKIYMNYIFPLVKNIDEGIECWVDPEKDNFGNFISDKIVYFTFIPDFASTLFMKILSPIETKLENSPLNKYSAHFFRVFENKKDA